MECKSTFVLNLFNIKAGKIVLPTLSDLSKPPQPLLKVAERSCCVLMRQGFDSRPQFGVRICNKTMECQSNIATDFSGFILLWRLFIVLQTHHDLSCR